MMLLPYFKNFMLANSLKEGNKVAPRSANTSTKVGLY